MAKAKAGPRQTTRKVTLELTEGEADLLLAVLACAAGHPSRTPRKYAERISAALEGALGYDFTETDAIRHCLGHVEFFEYDSQPVDIEDHFAYFLSLVEHKLVGDDIS